MVWKGEKYNFVLRKQTFITHGQFNNFQRKKNAYLWHLSCVSLTDSRKNFIFPVDQAETCMLSATKMYDFLKQQLSVQCKNKQMFNI